MKVNDIITEGLRDPKDNPCWKGYKPVGTKKKAGKTVPNCVPKEGMAEGDELNVGVEAYGVRGSDSKKWRKTFKSQAAFEKWLDANEGDVEVLGTREVNLNDMFKEDWQKANRKDKTSGMSQKAVNAYRREHPGSKLQTAVTTKPSKLKKGSKASKRRKSYCSRSKGQMDMHNIDCSKTPDKAICKARRRWNCE